MKRSKSLSVLILSVLLVLSLALGVFFIKPIGKASAIEGSKFFTYVESAFGDTEIKLQNDNVVIPMKNGNVVKLKNKVIANDLGIKFTLPANAKKLTLNVKADSYIATGNPLVDGTETTYETEVINALELVVEGANVNATFNKGVVSNLSYTADMELEVNFSVNADNQLSATLNGNALSSSNALYYTLEDIDKVGATIEFVVETAEDYTEAVNLNVVHVDQKVSDGSGAFKQTFKLNDSKSDLDKVALPRITLNDSFFAGNVAGGVDNNVIDGKNYTVNLTAYSVAGADLTKLEVEESDDDIIYVGNISSTSKLLNFNISTSLETVSISFVNKDDSTVVETYQIKVFDKDETAPTIIDITNPLDQAVLDSFKDALAKNTKAKYEIEGVEEEYSIRLGENEYLQIPSMKSLVKDEFSSYENLTYSVQYKNVTESSSYSSALKIPVKVAGEYTFFVLFTDAEKNAMESEDFVKLDDDGNPISGLTYEEYVFNFTLNDDAPMQISAVEQGKGYKGVVYTASAFDISASGYSVEYSLYYSETDIALTAEGLQRIYSLKDLDNGVESEDFTTSELENFAYDGELTFTPTEKGYYKIVCQVNSSNSERAVSDSAVIVVTDEPTYVKPDSKWLQNNVWSVVFLSVGTLCLIGIIILLCIKPKTATTESDNVKVKVIRSKKKNKN